MNKVQQMNLSTSVASSSVHFSTAATTKTTTNNEMPTSTVTPITPSQPSSSSIVLTDRSDMESVKQYAYAVCREYLGGVWKQADLDDDFKIFRITGGLTNHLYRCEIDSKKFHPVQNEPTTVLLRLYGTTDENDEKEQSTLKDIVIFAILSDHLLGPKLYGLFPMGRLEEFKHVSNLPNEDMYLPEVSCQIARALATFHSLQMPFNKEPTWLFATIHKHMNKVNHKSARSVLNKRDASTFDRFVDKFDNNLEEEFARLRAVLEKCGSPVVFCHNDLHTGNILLSSSENENEKNNKLQMIDYEYARYNYRGFDIGNHFCEWMMDITCDPFGYKYELYPTRDQQLTFVRAYLAECNKTSGGMRKMVDNQLIKEEEEHILKEANYFALASSLLWALWAVDQAQSSTIQFQYMDYAMARADAYFRHKKLLFPNGFPQ